ncbi:Uncharacterised protein [Mycobacteroides abscessus subsp. abscessus]|nr:Uncharacterised protein [Mycobacteroides abscessus subsp. abscessus]
MESATTTDSTVRHSSTEPGSVRSRISVRMSSRAGSGMRLAMTSTMPRASRSEAATTLPRTQTSDLTGSRSGSGA